MEQLFRLRRYLETPPSTTPKAAGCELCGAPLDATHSHVVDVADRRLICACRGCYLSFAHPEASGGRFRSAPEHVLELPDLTLDSASWEALDIPAGVVFFLLNSARNRIVALYPSPAGAIESTLPLKSWDEIVRANPLLGGLEPETQALLVCRRRDEAQAWIVPVDACYDLAGRIRRSWNGFGGDGGAWREIDMFLAEMRARVQPS